MASRVPFFDMTSAFEEIAPLVTSRIEAVLAQGRYILGPECTHSSRNSQPSSGSPVASGSATGWTRCAFA